MKLFANRKFAIVLSVFVVIFAMLIKARVTSAANASRVELSFYDGVYSESDGYTLPSIDSQLDRIATASLNITSLLQNHSDIQSEIESVLMFRRDFIGADSIKVKNESLEILVHALIRLDKKINEASDLTERETVAYTEYKQTINGALIFINKTLSVSYNERVDEFRKERSFITAILSNISPEYFREITTLMEN